MTHTRRTRFAKAPAVLLALVLIPVLPSGARAQGDQPPPPPPGQPQAPPPPTPPVPPIPPPVPPRGESPAAAEIAEGMELLQRGSLPAAAASFEKAIARDPSNPVAHQRLAYVRFRLSNFQAAKANAEKAVALDPNDSLAFLILGRAKEALGDRPGANAAFSAGAALEPKVTSSEQLAACALSLYLRAMQAVEKGEWAAAEADLKDVVRMYPKNGYVLYEHGLALTQLGKPAEGLEELKAAEEVNKTFRPAETWVYPNRRYYFVSENIRFWQGVALRQSGKHDEAVAVFESLFPKIESLAGATTAIEPPPGAVALEGHIDHSFRAAFYEDALALEAKGDKARALDVIKRYQKLRLNDEALDQKVKELQKRLK